MSVAKFGFSVISSPVDGCGFFLRRSRPTGNSPLLAQPILMLK
jgi:hypothetical protein